MDATPLYPQGFHPVVLGRTPDFRSRARPFSRFATSQQVKYYLADYDMSVKFEPGQSKDVLGETGADREVPELSTTVPYDAFKADVFILGNALRRRILNVSAAHSHALTSNRKSRNFDGSSS